MASFNPVPIPTVSSATDYHHLLIIIITTTTIITTRSYAALRAADLDWIVGPGYSSNRYILGFSQCLALCLRHSARIGPDLLCHPSSVMEKIG